MFDTILAKSHNPLVSVSVGAIVGVAEGRDDDGIADDGSAEGVKVTGAAVYDGIYEG